MPPNEVIIKDTDTPPEIPTEIVQAAAEAASEQAAADVAIAEINAEARVEEIQIIADAQVSQAEAAAEIATAVSREEFDECRKNFETLLTQHQEMQSQMQSILERLPPAHQSLNEPPASAGDAPPVQEPVAESPPEPEKKKSKVRWT